MRLAAAALASLFFFSCLGPTLKPARKYIVSGMMLECDGNYWIGSCGMTLRNCRSLVNLDFTRQLLITCATNVIMIDE